jgi:protein-S-isoprenylcysteine O-methyltransferase Ste14
MDDEGIAARVHGMKKQGPLAINSKLVRLVVFRYVIAIVVLGLMFFLSAGTIRYWYAWVFLAILFIPMFFVLLYLLRYDPALLERRMRTREKEVPQKLIIRLSMIPFLAAFLVPGLDYRFGWSFVPVAVIIAADVVVFCGYIFFFLVLRENSYASRVVEVEKEQKVISTGPYAYIRHPLYSAVLLIYLFSPLALGSFWALIAMIPLPFVLILRIKNEESLLKKELAGYEEYTGKVRYRLIPGIW